VAVALLGAAAGAGGCGRGADERSEPPFLAFGCGDDQRFLAFFAGPDTARLVAPDGIHTLVRVRSASGVRYAGGADTLWTKGPQALLIRGGRSLRGCEPTGRQRVLAALWREGAVFTAAGNEPFWTLTAWPDSLVLLLDLGATRLHRDLGPGRPWAGAAVGWADSAAGIAVRAEPGPCLDTMSGAPYPWRVTVRWQERELSGCGLDLGPRF
jgi:membrane-bound inhibitor of C-type lysozyme